MHPKRTRSATAFKSNLNITDLETIYCQTSSRLCGAILKVGDNRVMYVLLLFPQELCTDGVEGVTAQFMFSLHELQHIEL
jgi:hypothetical protein